MRWRKESRGGTPEHARAHLARLAREAEELLAPFSAWGRQTLEAEVARLMHTQPELPATVATHAQDSLDTPVTRVALAKAVILLREQGRIDDYLAAASLVDLSRPLSRLALSSAQMRPVAA